MPEPSKPYHLTCRYKGADGQDCGWVTSEYPEYNDLNRASAFVELREHRLTKHPEADKAAGALSHSTRQRGEPEVDDGLDEAAVVEVPETKGKRRSRKPPESATRTTSRITFKLPPVELPAIVLVRYQAWQANGYKGTMAEWLDEATEMVTVVAGYTPYGYILEEEDDDESGSEASDEVYAGHGPD